MRALMLVVLAAFATVVAGCGSVYYTVSANAASSKLEQARLMGAETQAPYEYYFAREHLRQAHLVFRATAEVSRGIQALGGLLRSLGR